MTSPRKKKNPRLKLKKKILIVITRVKKNKLSILLSKKREQEISTEISLMAISLFLALGEEEGKPYVQLYRPQTNSFSELKLFDYSLKRQVVDLEAGLLRQAQSEYVLAFKFRQREGAWD